MMSAFNPNARQLTPAEWQDVAAEAAEKSNPQIWVVGGIVGGLFAASATGFVPTGILVALWGFYEAWQRTQQANRNEMAVFRYGCVAYLLEGDDLRDFTRQVGTQEVIHQLTWATKNGYTLTADAEELLERAKSQTLPYISPVAVPPLPPYTPPPTAQPAPDTSMFPYSPLPTPHFNTQDMYSQYNSLTPVPPVSVVATQVKNFIPTDNDVVSRMARDFTNHLIIGVPGAGKGVLISNALRAIKELHPNVKICYIDPKGDKKETGYFEGVVDHLWRARALEMSPGEFVAWVMGCFQEFQLIRGDKLIVFDEGTVSISKFKNYKGALPWLKDKIVSYCSCGDSEGIRFWIVAQNPHTEDLGINGGLRSQLVPICLIQPKNIAAYTAIIATSLIPSDKKVSSDELEMIAERSPVGRAIYHGGINEWVPMQKLKNYSGYDRDKREFLNSSISTQINTNESGSVAVKPKTQAQILIEKLAATPQTSLSGFIEHDLKIQNPEMAAAMRTSIIGLLTQENRQDLLTKFL